MRNRFRTFFIAATLVAAGSPALASQPALPPPDFSWTGADNTTTYGDSGNWDIGIPSGVSYVALIDGSILNSPVVVDATASPIDLGTGGTQELDLTNGATLNDDVIVGDTSNGVFVNVDSTHNVSGNLILGNQSTGNGTYTITGDSAQTNVNFVAGGNGPSSTNGPGNANPNGALIVGEFGNGTFIQGTGTDTPTVNVAGDLSLGHQGLAGNPDAAPQDSSGTYTINSGTLTVGGSIEVGGASTANDGSLAYGGKGNPSNIFTQAGGTVTVTGSAGGFPHDYVGVGTSDHIGELLIGGAAGPNNDGGSGAYNMEGGTLNVGLIEVGHTGLGVMTQTGGTVNASIWLGNAGGSQGYYSLSNGNINAGSVDVSLGGNGTFTQSGGTLSITHELDVGSLSGQGTFTLSDGSVTSATTIVGDGTLNGCCGIHFGGSGILNVSAGSLSTGALTVGIFAQGTVNQSGGTVAATSLTIATAGSSIQPVDTYNLTGTGILNVSGNEIVGVEGNGNFVQGTLSDAGATQNNVTGTLFIGNAFDGLVTPDGASNIREGSYTLNTGTLTTNETVVGATSIGSFTQNGGTHNTNLLIIGDQSLPTASGCTGGCITGGPAPGTYTMNAGQLSINGNSALNNFASVNGGTGMILGNAGTGVFNQIDGTVTSGTSQILGGCGSSCNSPGTEGDVVIGAQSGSQGTYNLGDASNQAPNLTVNGSIIIGRDAGSNVNTVPGAAPVGANLVVAGDGTNLNVFYNGGSSNANPLSSDIMVGLNGNGAVTQSDASAVYMDGDLSIGINSGAVGSYNLNATSLGVGFYNLTVGNYLNLGGAGEFVNSVSEQTTPTGGTGYFTQTSGDVLVIQDANIGNNSGTGTYTISGGTLSVASQLNIGNNGGNGYFYQSGGSSTTVGTTLQDGALQIGTWGPGGVGTTGGTGTYSISGDTTALTVNGNVIIARDPGSVGSSLTIGNGTDNPTVTVQSSNGGGYLTVGAGDAGSLTIKSGLLTVSALTYIGGSPTGVGTVIQTGGTFDTGGLSMGVVTDTGSPSNSYTLSGNASILSVSGAFVIGSGPLGGFPNGSGGTFTQNGGSVIVGDAYINNGTYNLNAGTFTSNYDVRLGDTKTGALFDQSAGTTATITNDLLVGGTFAGGSSAIEGTYDLTGGTLTVLGNTFVGFGGQGFFSNDGGNHSTNNLILGQQGGSGGTYTLKNAGQLTTIGFFDVGEHGTGEFDQSSGTTTVGTALDLGRCGSAVGCLGLLDTDTAVGSGTIKLSGGSLSVGTFAVVGDSGIGSLTQSGAATVSVTGELDVGRYGGQGTYTLGGNGSLTVGGDLNIGTATGALGTFNYNVTSGDAASLKFAGSSQTLVVGDAGTGYFHEGSSTNSTDLNLQMSGTMLDIGRASGGAGTFNLASGSSLEDDMIVGDAGTGTFNNNGGTNTVGTSGSPASLILGNAASGIGTYNNNGGSNTINGNLIVGAEGTGYYYLGNGTSGSALSVQGTGLSGGNVLVGESGTGTIMASNGAVATIAGVLTLGGPSPGETTGNGTLTVTGTGTKWTNDGQTQIGGFGTGNLNVLAGGYVESQNGGSPSGTSSLLGGASGAQGSALIDGTNSEWKNTGALRIGDFGQGNLTIQNGGTVIDNAGTDGTAASVGWQVGSVGTVILTGVTLWANAGNVVVGDAGKGTVNVGGTSALSLSGNLILGNQTTGDGTLTLADGGSLTFTGASGTQSLVVGGAGQGLLAQNGGNLDLATNSVSLTVGANGEYDLTNGSVSANNVTNNGTIRVSSSIANFGGTFINNGAYISDPSVSNFNNLKVGSTGYLIGGPGDIFDVKGNLLSTSTQNTSWDTSSSKLQFSTGGTVANPITSHTFDLTGIDVGASAAGYADNFAWGTLAIDASNSISLEGTGTNALYLQIAEGLLFAGDQVTNIFGDGFNIYYNPNADGALGDQVYALENGGFLCPIGASSCTLSTGGPGTGVPEPVTLSLFGAGLAGAMAIRRRKKKAA